MTSRSRPIRSSNAAEEAIDGGRIRHVDAGRPRVGRVQAETESPGRDAACHGRFEDIAELDHVRAQPEAAARRVLEDDPGGDLAHVGIVDLGKGQRQAFRQPARPSRDTGPAMRPDVDVDEPPEVAGRGAQLAGKQPDRSPEQVIFGAGQVDQVGGVDGDRPDVELDKAGPELGLVDRWLGTAPPRRRVVAPDLECLRPDLVRPLHGLDHARGEREVGAEASSVGKHPRHRTTGRRPTRGVTVAAFAAALSAGCPRLPVSSSCEGAPSCSHHRWRAR